MAAAHFEPTGLEFVNPVTISIPNPIPDVTFAESDMQLTYLNTTTGKWDVQTSKVNLKMVVIRQISSTSLLML